MCVLSIKVPMRKKSLNLFNDPRIYIYIYIQIFIFSSYNVWKHVRYSVLISCKPGYLKAIYITLVDVPWIPGGRSLNSMELYIYIYNSSWGVENTKTPLKSYQNVILNLVKERNPEKKRKKKCGKKERNNVRKKERKKERKKDKSSLRIQKEKGVEKRKK